MQRLYEHINVFTELMERKGYDGHYLSSYGFTDKLKENLTKHVLQCFEEKKEPGPLNLSTYSKWTDDQSPYVRCDFHVGFSDAKGFEVLKMDILYANQYGKIREKEIPLKNNNEIPDRDRANRMIIGRKQRMKL
jgi:hypothetical protein